MNTVHLDGSGRLLKLEAIPLFAGFENTRSDEPDWPVLFELAGLSMDQFHAVEPVRRPPFYAEQVVAWGGVYPGDAKTPIRVEAAALGGRIVYFDVVPPWQAKAELPRSSKAVSRTFVVRSLFYLAALVGGILLAWYNLRLGRGDLRGAGRLACFVLVLALLDWMIGKRHVAAFIEEMASSYLWIARATFAAATTWIGYVAMEPYVRRHWPQTMITWSRFLNGRLRDPLLGRDVLIGSVAGIVLVLVLQVDTLIPSWLGMTSIIPRLPGPGYELSEFLRPQYRLGTVVSLLLAAISFGIGSLLLMLLLRLVVRVPWLASLAFCVLLAAALSAVSSCDTFLPWMTNGILAIGLVAILTRVGLVAAIAAVFVKSIITTSPITSDFGAWYAPTAGLSLILVALLLIYGFYTGLAGQSIAARQWLDD